MLILYIQNQMMVRLNFRLKEKKIIQESMNGLRNFMIQIMRIQNLKCI